MEEFVEEIVHLLKDRYGVNFGYYDRTFLQKSLEKRWMSTGTAPAGYLRLLESDPREAFALADSMQITYSEFFRNPLSFALLEQHVLPRLAGYKPAEGEIRVWSAGCAAGQEAYSIAMLLDQCIASTGKALRFRVIATDTSRTALEIAGAGSYDADAVRNVRLKDLQAYFTREGDRYTVLPRLRETVSFSTYDLLDRFSFNPPESIYGEFDLVFCSNLLFYYNQEVQRFILNKMARSLAVNGYLVTGEAERSLVEKMEHMQMVSVMASVFQVNRM